MEVKRKSSALQIETRALFHETSVSEVSVCSWHTGMRVCVRKTVCTRGGVLLKINIKCISSVGPDFESLIKTGLRHHPHL